MRKTKIIATLGPATRELDLLTKLLSAGADVLRFNFSHGTADQHAELVSRAREASERAGRDVALLADLPGPKLRVGEIEGDAVAPATGQTLELTTRDAPGT